MNGPPRILFIDAYDSFSSNIISLLETTLSCSVRTVKIDNPVLLASDSALRDELSHYAAVVCGPGPGSPQNEEDVGIIKKIWRLREQDLLPVLGICLGFQSLCLEFGAEVKRLKGPQHGIVRKVTHVGQYQTVDNTKEEGSTRKPTIFEGVGELQATHYQSLCADIGQDAISEQAWERSKWSCSASCPLLVPLAYAESDLAISNDSGIKDARVLVGVQHTEKPFWALQYHPESICTVEESHKVITNWFKLAQTWNRDHRRQSINQSEPEHGIRTVRPSLLSRILPDGIAGDYRSELECIWRSIALPSHVSVADLADEFCSGEDRVIFESSNTNELVSGTADVRGRYSIIALETGDSPIIEYQVGANHASLRTSTSTKKVVLGSGGVWAFIARYMEHRRVLQGPTDSPFCGGFMGYSTYEHGLESIEVQSTKPQHQSRPDLSYIWVMKSLVIDHRANTIYIQELCDKQSRPQADTNLLQLQNKLHKFFRSKLPPSPTGSFASGFDSLQPDTPLTSPSHSTPPSRSTSQAPAKHHVAPFRSVQKPSNTSYESKVVRCQDFISAGDSYELCLTDRTTVTRTKPSSSKASSWNLYKSLRVRQPAPFASYIRLGGATLVSSSPERFLTWDEANNCHLRPMKGTVRKSAEVDTLEKAKILLDVPKEKAENLMIVDLVRHDLHSICGSGNVSVPRLCVVEEYKSVFTMISVVEGRVPPPSQDPSSQDFKERHTGLDVLAASLPPGSMTGAPKKRSCEILQGIEGKERSLYSGVVGYLDVRGRGDWSVTIRSMFKWDDEDEIGDDGVETEKWHIGAGGAVTTLSTAIGETEEMLTKLNGTLGVFG